MTYRRECRDARSNTSCTSTFSLVLSLPPHRRRILAFARTLQKFPSPGRKTKRRHSRLHASRAAWARPDSAGQSFCNCDYVATRHAAPSGWSHRNSSCFVFPVTEPRGVSINDNTGLYNVRFSRNGGVVVDTVPLLSLGAASGLLMAALVAQLPLTMKVPQRELDFGTFYALLEIGAFIGAGRM